MSEVKREICANCGDRYCCRGITSCKDANEYIAKKGKDRWLWHIEKQNS